MISNSAGSSDGSDLPGPRTLFYSTWALVIANFALAILPSGRKFIPSQLAIGLAIAFGMLCAAYCVYAIRLARRRLEDVEAQERESLRKQLGKPVLILALLHVASGTAGFEEGVCSLYTAAFGTPHEITYVVEDVNWKTGRVHCFKHQFAGLSFLQNYFGAPCLDLGYEPGSRFHYRGRSSLLGFKQDQLEIESEQPPLRHKR